MGHPLLNENIKKIFRAISPLHLRNLIRQQKNKLILFPSKVQNYSIVATKNQAKPSKKASKAKALAASSKIAY